MGAGGRESPGKRRSGIQPLARLLFLFLMVSSLDRAPAEGRSSWIAVGAIVLLTLLAPMWIAFGGTSPGVIEGSTLGSPIVILPRGEQKTFAPGRMDEGSVLACQASGLTVSAAVPAAGRSVAVHQDPVTGFGVTTRIFHLADDRVRLRCTR